MASEANYAQVSETLIQHPKTTRAMRALRVNRYQLVGHLVSLWNWSLKNAPDGDLSRFSARDIADASGFTDPDDFDETADQEADRFVQALVGCRTTQYGDGFLEMGDEVEPGLWIHDWQNYGGKLMAKREASRRRAASARTSHAQDSPPPQDPVTGETPLEDSALRTAYVTRTSHDNTRTSGVTPIGEERREEKSTVYTGSSPVHTHLPESEPGEVSGEKPTGDAPAPPLARPASQKPAKGREKPKPGADHPAERELFQTFRAATLTRFNPDEPIPEGQFRLHLRDLTTLRELGATPGQAGTLRQAMCAAEARWSGEAQITLKALARHFPKLLEPEPARPRPRPDDRSARPAHRSKADEIAEINDRAVEGFAARQAARQAAAVAPPEPAIEREPDPDADAWPDLIRHRTAEGEKP